MKVWKVELLDNKGRVCTFAIFKADDMRKYDEHTITADNVVIAFQEKVGELYRAEDIDNESKQYDC